MARDSVVLGQQGSAAEDCLPREGGEHARLSLSFRGRLAGDVLSAVVSSRRPRSQRRR
jgi:hypothetical protein